MTVEWEAGISGSLRIDQFPKSMQRQPGLLLNPLISNQKTFPPVIPDSFRDPAGV